MKRKSRFLTFIAAMIPGAGQMYQGQLKRGASIMILFSAVCAFSIFTMIGELCIFLPVLWFYAFFDALNKSDYTRDELHALEDRPIFGVGMLKEWENSGTFSGKSSILIGAVFIFVGIILLYRTLLMPLLYAVNIPGLYEIATKVPALFIGVIVILLGIKIIRGREQRPE